MELEQEQLDDVAVIRLNGELDFSTAPRLERTIQEIIDGGRLKLLIDLNGVPYVDSSGIGAFLHAYRKVSGQGGGVKLINVAESIRNVMNMMRILDYVRLHESESEALKAYASGN